MELVKEIPVYLTRPENGKYYLGRYPSQVNSTISTLSKASNLKIKPKQTMIEAEIPLFSRNTQVSDLNSDQNKIDYFKQYNHQKIEGSKHFMNPSTQLFVGQVAVNSKTDTTAMHLTPLSGVIFFKPKHTILDELEEERRWMNKELQAHKLVEDGIPSTDEEPEPVKIKSSELVL